MRSLNAERSSAAVSNSTIFVGLALELEQDAERFLDVIERKAQTGRDPACISSSVEAKVVPPMPRICSGTRKASAIFWSVSFSISAISASFDGDAPRLHFQTAVRIGVPPDSGP